MFVTTAFPISFLALPALCGVMLVSPWMRGMGGAGDRLEALGGAGLVAKPKKTFPR
jgi:hypothetical protein